MTREEGCRDSVTERTMADLALAPCRREKLRTFDAYLASLSAPIDSFLEDLILDASPYSIRLGHREIGSFSHAESGTLMQFHLLPDARRWSHSIFAEVRDRFAVSAAVVPTCDEFLLGLALDDTTEIEKAAFFFVDGTSQKAPQGRIRLRYRPAEARDLDAIRTTNEDFLDDPAEELGKGQLHVGHLGEEIVALGLIIESRLLGKHASIGIFTREAYRRQGIATSTVDYLRRTCRTRGLIPIAGCWYYNEASRRTLEAAGMTVSSRLLKFVFSQGE